MLPCTITCSHHLEQLLEQSLDWRKMTFFEIKRILIRSESEYLDLEQFVKDSSATLSGLGNKAHRTNLAGGKQIDADDWQTLGNTFPGRQTQYFRRICSFRVAGRKKINMSIWRPVDKECIQRQKRKNYLFPRRNRDITQKIDPISSEWIRMIQSRSPDSPIPATFALENDLSLLKETVFLQLPPLACSHPASSSSSQSSPAPRRDKRAKTDEIIPTLSQINCRPKSHQSSWILSVDRGTCVAVQYSSRAVMEGRPHDDGCVVSSS